MGNVSSAFCQTAKTTKNRFCSAAVEIVVAASSDRFGQRKTNEIYVCSTIQLVLAIKHG